MFCMTLSMLSGLVKIKCIAYIDVQVIIRKGSDVSFDIYRTIFITFFSNSVYNLSLKRRVFLFPRCLLFGCLIHFKIIELLMKIKNIISSLYVREMKSHLCKSRKRAHGDKCTVIANGQQRLSMVFSDTDK